MIFTEFGMVIEVSPVQLTKTPFPMLVMELGITIDVIFVQFEKAPPPFIGLYKK